MAISIGHRDEDIEGIPWQRKKIVWFWAFTAQSSHGASIPVRAIAINGVVAAMTGGSGKAKSPHDRAALPRRLVVTKCRHRIEPRRAVRGPDARANRHAQQHHRDAGER